MATCPRCLGPLSEGHHCRPIWVRRFIRQALATLIGGGLGAAIQLFTTTDRLVPIMGIVVGGLLFLGISEAVNPN
jgi:hypothetical protein